jgi:hypothetical protein
VIIGTDCIGSYKSMRSRPRRPRLLLEWFVFLCLVISYRPLLLYSYFQ